MEFGQIPKQVFKKPHPARTCAVIALEKSSPTFCTEGDSSLEVDLYFDRNN